MHDSKIEVFCDESSLENLFKTNKSGYMVLGGVWLDKKDHKKIKKDLDNLKMKHDVKGEFKWNKVSNSREKFYFEVLDYFFGNRKLRFRCIVIDTSKVNIEKYHSSDNELGFYKFYFNLLNKWCNNNSKYYVYLDNKSNKDLNRLPKLKEILNCVSEGEITELLPMQSKESVFIQLADLLTGAISHKFNVDEFKGETKKEFIERLEEHLGRKISSTSSSEKKFNIFQIRLKEDV